MRNNREDEIYIYVKSKSGTMVRIPERDYDSWKKAQDENKPLSKERAESLRRTLAKIAGIDPDKK